MVRGRLLKRDSALCKVWKSVCAIEIRGDTVNRTSGSEVIVRLCGTLRQCSGMIV